MIQLNYKQLLTYFSSIAYHHEQIRSFGFGDMTQITMDVTTQKSPLYPRLYLVPDSVQFNQNHIHYNFNVLVIDKINNDLSNQEEVLSDTLEIAQDIWTTFYQSYTYQSGNFSQIVVGDWQSQVQSFIERFDDVLGGWNLSLRLDAPFDYSKCGLPMSPDYNFPQDQRFASYKEMILNWRHFAEAHQQVRSFGFGELNNITMDIVTQKSPLYPRLYFVPNSSVLGQNEMNITWTVFVVDKLNTDLKNQSEILSDTLEIAKDFYAKAYLSDYNVAWDMQLSPWLEEADDVLAGWSFQMIVQQKFDYNRCVLPITTFGNGITWEELAVLWELEYQKWSEIKKTN